MQIIPTNAAAGAEIRGVDLSKPIDAATFAAIDGAFNEYGVIFFRDQNLTPAQQMAFSRMFGEIERNMFSESWSVPGEPDMVVVSNITKDGKLIGAKRAGEAWHSDMCYTPRPPRGSMLYAQEVPELFGMTLGDTCFASAAAAYDALPEATKRRIADLQVIFSFRGRKRSYPVSEEQMNRYPDVQHPLVRTHPATGRKCLYVMRDDSTGIAGMPQDEAAALIAALADHIVRPEFVYRHRWRKGDVLMWDNCTVQHKAIQDYDLPQRRLMHRTTMGGSAPF
ncbi:MAG: TauD/TfdA dioxygenase family protein [Bdellovibrionales bacterium]